MLIAEVAGTLRITSGKIVITSAPRMAPRHANVPPTTANTSMSTARWKPKSAGEKKGSSCAERAPATPAMHAPAATEGQRPHPASVVSTADVYAPTAAEAALLNDSIAHDSVI